MSQEAMGGRLRLSQRRSARRRFFVLLAGLIVVIPAEGLGLFQDVDVIEVLEELVDKGGVELGIEGVARQALAQIIEDGFGLVHERIS
jgi:hypothetical protein